MIHSCIFYFCHSTRFYHNLKKEIRIYGYTNPVLSTLYPDVPWFAIPNLSVAPGAMNVDKQSVLHFVRHCPIATMPEFFLLQTLQKPDSRWQSRAPTFSRGGSTRRDSLLTLVIEVNQLPNWPLDWEMWLMTNVTRLAASGLWLVVKFPSSFQE